MRTRLITLAIAILSVAACAPDYPAPPSTQVQTVMDSLHGLAFVDDYRWLESQEAPETRRSVFGLAHRPRFNNR